MATQEERIERLQNRLEDLVRRHGRFAGEILEIRKEIDEIRDSMGRSNLPETSEMPQPPVAAHAAAPPPESNIPRPEPIAPETSGPTFGYEKEEAPRTFPLNASNLEEWVGGNLASKIGIAITILGVAIGAKYAIDRGWITPVMRIVFGYLVGAGLLFFAIRLRENYERFSAVLLSGATAIFYFISYAAYDYYSLIPQSLAFALMTFFTVFTVLAAIRYERVLIAHIGLVGAYGVPFLLSEESGRVAFLFSYMSVINAGILVVSIARYWRSLFYSSFLLTWAIYLAWFQLRYSPDVHFTLALAFSFVFFAIFYATFIVYKLLEGKQFPVENAALVIANAFIYYGFLYAIADDNEVLSGQLGLITVGNAALHFAVAFAIHRFASADRSVIALLVALVIAFITIAVPVQLEGEWVTVAWAAEAAVLFAIGRTRSIPVYEWLSYPLFAIAFLSLLNTWEGMMSDPAPVPVFNSGFVTNLFVSACLILSLWIDRSFGDETVLEENAARVTRLVLGGAAIFVTYMTFGFEVANYWEFSDAGSVLYERFKFVSLLVYSIAFTVGLAYLNRRYIRDNVLSALCVALALILLLGYLTAGLATLNAIADAFWFPDEFGPQAGPLGLLIRYVAFASSAALFLILQRTDDADSAVPGIPSAVRRKALDVIVHVAIVATLSAELLMWLDAMAAGESTPLGLSLLWGLYSVMLVIVGIRAHKKHLRLAAICLFAFTLGKVFVYDLSGLGTIARTVLFVSLGILLLVASYLYNRYSSIITEPDEN